MPEVLIIGAGPAGCVAAIVLARGGWEVQLAEQHRFPRDKVCGECLSALGIEVLRRLGLLRSLEPLDYTRLNRAHLHAPNGSSLKIELPHSMIGISRRAFDQFLLDAARRAGATARQMTRCEQIDFTGSPEVQLRSLESNQVETARPDWVLVADGKSAFSDPRPRAAGDFGIKCHFERIAGPRDAIELFGVRACYGGLAAVEGGRWNLAFSVPQARIQRHGGDIERLFSRIIDENRILGDRLRRARRVSDWLAAPLPRFGVRNHWPERVIPIGNAAAAIEPIGGEGMGLAMRSAELAADMLIEWHSMGQCPDELVRMPGKRAENGPDRRARNLRRQFQQLWRPRGVACRATALALANPMLANFALPVVDGTEPPFAMLLRLIGKSG